MFKARPEPASPDGRTRTIPDPPTDLIGERERMPPRGTLAGMVVA